MEVRKVIHLAEVKMNVIIMECEEGETKKAASDLLRIFLQDFLDT